MELEDDYLAYDETVQDDESEDVAVVEENGVGNDEENEELEDANDVENYIALNVQVGVEEIDVAHYNAVEILYDHFHHQDTVEVAFAQVRLVQELLSGECELEELLEKVVPWSWQVKQEV